MQEYQFDLKEYKKRVANNNYGAPFAVLIFVCVLLMGAIFFLKPKTQKNVDLLYFVEINNFLNYSSANTLAQEIQTKGGAGYVYFDGKYHVFASVYLTKTDAKSVCENLKENYPTSKIFELEIKKNLDVKNLTELQKESVKNLAEQGKNTFSQIYSNILALDKTEIDHNQAVLNFKTIKNNFIDVSNNFNTAFNENSKYNKAKNYLSTINTPLENLSNEKIVCNYKYELINFAINFLNILNCF